MLRILLFILFLPCFAFAQERPNIIFILTDDQRWDAIGYAGNKIIQTPEMDQLASEGIFFSNAFVTTPICAASRASILTGLYERTHTYTFGQGNIKSEFIEQSYPALIRNHGYYTGFFGKFGIEYPDFNRLFDVGENYDRNTRYHDRRGYFYKTLGNDTVHLTRYTGQKALDFIENAPKDRPFCLSLSFSAPHAHDPSEEQYYWKPETAHLYQDIHIPDPIMASDSYFVQLPEYVRKGENRTRWHWRFDTPEKYQQSVKGYYRMITGIDLEIGKIRSKLKELHLEKNTIIILMGDNGYFLGERQLAGKWLMYDNSLRVPLILFDPRTYNHRNIDDAVLNIDIAPTLFGLIGEPVPDRYQGVDLSGYLYGKNPALKRKQFIIEHLWKVPIIPASEGIRTDRWKYFRYRDHLEDEELYDLKKDPLEKTNLAKDKDHQKLLISLRKKFETEVQRLSR